MTLNDAKRIKFDKVLRAMKTFSDYDLYIEALAANEYEKQLKAFTEKKTKTGMPSWSKIYDATKKSNPVMKKKKIS